jgi:hypothetical protein
MLAWLVFAALQAAPLDQPPNTWVKRSPLEDTPVSPRLGYEGDCVWYAKHRVLLRYGGHNQGGGGEQGSEVWTYDPFTAKWTHKEPNTSPPGVCCEQQNVYDPVRGRYLRFPAFSLSHGWQWPREIYLNNDTVWTYDLETNTWRNMRPIPQPHVAGLRAASWDAHEEVAVVFGGEGSQEGTLVYDPAVNSWIWKKPRPQPEFRSGGNMAYDAARKLHVLFGAQFSNDPHTWAYDLAKNEWRDLKPEILPPTDKNDAVLAYDSLHEVIVAIVKISQGKDEAAKHRLETWAFDAGRNEWRKMDPPLEPDAGGNRTRVLAFAPELGMTILENCIQIDKKREQQIWTYRYGDRKPAPAADAPRARKEPRVVEDVVVSVLSTSDAVIQWKPVEEGVKGYVVERAVVEVWSEDQLTRLKSRTAPLAEPSVGAVRRVGAFRRITAEPVQGTSFIDKGLDLAKPGAVEGEPLYERKMHKDQLDPSGKPYRFGVHAYRVRAVGAGGESGPSPAAYTIPSIPQSVFSKEEGTVCHLKWAANPEMGVKGYRVYRMDGRFDKEPVSRLTQEPIEAREYSDAAAGKKTRRYYVVAVDALGQEGHPSSPVWHEREWKKYYLPFTGEWHQ